MLQYTGKAPAFLNCVDFAMPLPYVPRSNAAPGAVEKMLWLKGSWLAYSTVDPVVTTRTRGENCRPLIAICDLAAPKRAGAAFGTRYTTVPSKSFVTSPGFSCMVTRPLTAPCANAGAAANTAAKAASLQRSHTLTLYAPEGRE